MIRCPYHAGGQERTPSMSVSLIKPVFFCHGCKEQGHVSKLLQHFGASKSMASKIVDRTKFSEAGERRAPRPTSNKAPIAHGIKEGPRGPGKAYILSEDVLDEYRLAPKRLLDAGFKAKTLQSFGVGVDEKNGRITFPLRDFDGNLVGISGRGYLGQDQKYKIYKKELIERRELGIPNDYSLDSIKGQLLWNGYRALPLVEEGQPLTITEGFKAAMWLWQCGYENTVALIGSYLTHEHAERISKCNRDPQVILFLDADEAGIKGTEKAMTRLIKKGVSVKIARYPDDERLQPDELDQDEIENAINNSQTFIEWQLNGAQNG